MQKEKMELFFIFWKKSYIWSVNKDVKSEGRIELWKSMIERMSENAKRKLDK
jgi:hypothetical protein